MLRLHDEVASGVAVIAVEGVPASVDHDTDGLVAFQQQPLP